VDRLAIGHDAGHYGGPHAFTAIRRRDTARAFRAAVRHSRFVRTLRVGIPICCTIAVAGLAVFAWLDPTRMFGNFSVRLSDLVISGTKIKMEQPRLSGFTRDARPYDLTARYAAQDITKPDLVELSGLRAKVLMQDTSTVEMSAATGLFNTKSEVLNLEKDIVVISSSGYRGDLTQAVVDTRKGNLTSNKPVSIKLPEATINSNGIEIENSGEMIRFTGGVSVTMTNAPVQKPGADQAASQ
jgi:lipopolysaccharide export system protein LptC